MTKLKGFSIIQFKFFLKKSNIVKFFKLGLLLFLMLSYYKSLKITAL